MTLTRQDLIVAALLVGAAVLGGWLTGSPGWCWAAALLVWSLLQLRERQRLVRWSRHPLRRPDTTYESWETVAERLRRALLRSRGRQHALLTRMKALRVVTDALPDAAIIISRSGDIENLNRAALELLHLKPSDIGRSLPTLIRQPDFVTLLKGETQLVEFRSPFDDAARLEARRITIDGERLMILVRNVTELNRLLTMRQDFVANVSHELRTPLTVIVGYVETLLGEPLDMDTVRELLNKLRSPVNRMRALVDDLLLLSRLESSPMPGEDELCRIDMRVLLNAVAADARALSAGVNDIQVEIASGAQLLGVENELHSACANLVTNAVRYSPDGGDIRVRWTDEPGGARFAVQDHGMGIPTEHISRITERFYRVDLAKARVRGGTGLGLAIVKHVLKRHHSELKIESRLTQGSTFYCDFPETQLRRGSQAVRAQHAP